MTLAGTDKFALLSVSVTPNPPPGAAELIVTEQFALPGVLTLVGEQVNPVRTGAGRASAMEPLPPVAGMEFPPASVATTLVS